MVYEENTFYNAGVSLPHEYITGGRERTKKHRMLPGTRILYSGTCNLISLRFNCMI